MGIETTCRVETEAGAGDARVLLETEELVVRGALKTGIPFKSVQAAMVDGRKVPAREARCQAEHGGVLSGHRRPRPARRARRGGGDHLVGANQDKLGPDSPGVERDAGVSRIAPAVASLRPSGAIWMIHPKGREGVKDTAIFAAGREAGLVATTVAKFSESHTAEKLVIPVAKRR